MRPRTVAQVAIAAACAIAMPAGAHAAGIAPRQQIVTLLGAHAARSGPADTARQVAQVAAHRPLTGGATRLPVLGRSTGPRGRVWLHVRLPGRALGAPAPPRTGWIRATHARVATTIWHIVVDRRSRNVIVYRAGRRAHSYRAIVGAPATPTPRGEYFVEENVRMPAGRPGAPFALALSARSGVFQEFDGGPGQIAIHGIRNIGGQLGTSVSHGCIRLGDDGITWLGDHIPPGVPVSIR